MLLSIRAAAEYLLPILLVATRVARRHSLRRVPCCRLHKTQLSDPTALRARVAPLLRASCLGLHKYKQYDLHLEALHFTIKLMPLGAVRYRRCPALSRVARSDWRASQSGRKL